jgi:hypothetical protein
MKTKLIVGGALFVVGTVLEGFAGLVMSSSELAEVLASLAKAAVKK